MIDGARLSSEVVLAPLTVLWAEAPDDPDRVGAVRTLLRRYLWRAFVATLRGCGGDRNLSGVYGASSRGRGWSRGTVTA